MSSITLDDKMLGRINSTSICQAIDPASPLLSAGYTIVRKSGKSLDFMKFVGK